MAVLGMTKLLGVNRILRANLRPPVSALDAGGAGGTSDAARAQEILEEVSLTVQIRGLHENTVFCKANTLDGSGKLTIGSDTLSLKGAGPQQRRDYALRSDKVYDQEADTDVLGAAAGTIYLDIIRYMDFETLDPANKEFIANEAAIVYQRRWRGNPEQDAALTQEAAKTELFAKKPRPSPNTGIINPFGVLNQPTQPQGGQGG